MAATAQGLIQTLALVRLFPSVEEWFRRTRQWTIRELAPMTPTFTTHNPGFEVDGDGSTNLGGDFEDSVFEMDEFSFRDDQEDIMEFGNPFP
jgi:hypothetical protein